MSQGQATKRNPSSSKKQKARNNNNSSNGGSGKAPRNQGNMRAPREPFNQRGDMSRAVITATSKVMKTQRPRMQTSRNGDCHIVHREYITDIQAGSGSPSTFNLAASLPVNPGQVGVFKWMSRIAKNFESFRFNSLRFAFETEAPSSLGGTLILALDYDAQDPPPTSKQQAMTYRESVRSAPWSPCVHRSLKEDLNKQKSYFVRPGAQPAGTDIRLYDVGNLFVMTQGVTTAGATCGELYVEYDVLLMTPVFEPTGDSNPSGGEVGGNNTITPANPLGIAPIVEPGAVGIGVDNASNISLQEAGEYLITVMFTGTVITADALTAVSGAPTINSQGIQTINAAATQCVDMWSVNSTIDNAIVHLALTATTATATSMWISQVPTNSV